MANHLDISARARCHQLSVEVYIDILNHCILPGGIVIVIYIEIE